MTLQQQLTDMTRDLLKGTQEGAIKWSETAEENAFRTVLAQALVRVEQHDDPFFRAGEGAVPITTGLPFPVPQGFKSFGEFIYCLVVLNDRNRELIRYFPESEEQAALMKRLWELAAQSARNVGSQLSDILKALSEKVHKTPK